MAEDHEFNIKLEMNITFIFADKHTPYAKELYIPTHCSKLSTRGGATKCEIPLIISSFSRRDAT